MSIPWASAPHGGGLFGELYAFASDRATEAKAPSPVPGG